MKCCKKCRSASDVSDEIHNVKAAVIEVPDMRKEVKTV